MSTMPQPLFSIDVWTFILFGMFVCLLVGVGYGIWWLQALHERLERHEIQLVDMQRDIIVGAWRHTRSAEEEAPFRPQAQAPAPQPP